MNIKKKLIAFFIFSSILTLLILNVKNPEKTKFYFFTSKIERISLGNLITITFISGFTFSSLLGFIYKNNSEEISENNFRNGEEIENSDDNNFNQELESNRPPERDVRESQPTISVNYRFVDQDDSYVNLKNSRNNLKNDDNDWLNYDNEW